MHRAIASYTNGAPAAVLDDTTVLEQYGAMVERMARRLISRTGLRSAYDDLWSAGAIGLIEAGRRFDVSRGASFATFAEHRVRGAMLDELRRLDHLPRRLRNRTDDLVKTRKRLAGNLGREATVEEVATELGVDVEEASDMAALLEPPLPLESILPTLAGAEATDAAVLRAEAVRRLTEALEKLPERLRMVLSLHYIEDLTYREIAGMLAVSEPRVCQLHSEALAQLRKLLAET
jgi:RNA polymerase sigma factor for flagellar operon FliA